MSLKLLADLVVLLLVLGTTAIVLLGWGNLTWRILGIEQPNKPSAITVWLGFCIVVGCTEIVHLFVPLDWKVALAFAVTGTLGCRLNTKSIALVGNNQSTAISPASGFLLFFFNTLRNYPFRSFLAAIVLIVWCLRAMEAPSMYDSGLYHFGSIRWLNEYAIVPGLGNLHWRLALNQSYFGFLALLNFAPYWDRGYAAGGLFLLLLTSFTLLEIGLNQTRLWRWVFGGILFSYLCLLSGPIANPMPDTGVALLQVVMFGYTYSYLTVQIRQGSRLDRQLQRLTVVLSLLCLTIVTVKLSSIAFAMATFAIVALLTKRYHFHLFSRRQLLLLLLMLGLFSITHVGRGYLLSGAPFFPSPIGGVWSLPWAVHYGVAHNESQLIYAWAKQPGVETASDLIDGFGWISAWIKAQPIILKFYFISSFVVMLGFLILRQTAKNKAGNYRYALLGVPISAALFFWFFSAPDPRFLGAVGVLIFVWSVCLMCLQIELTFFNKLENQKAYLIDLLARLAIIFIVCSLFVRWSYSGLLPPLGWMSIPSPSVFLHSNEYGTQAFSPTEDNAQCWSAPLPCAPEIHGGLQKKLMDLPSWFFRLPGDRFTFSLVR